MRSILRQVVAISASASIVFFWSCERHEVGELPDHSNHTKAGHDDHGKAGGHGKDAHADKSGHTDDNPNPADGGAHQHGTGTPPPGQGQHKHDAQQQASPACTPAQFFPSPTPQ